MTASHPDFFLYSGSTWEFDATLHDAACNPLDLTGAEIAWRLYDIQRAVKIELTVGDGITVVNATSGLCKITVPAVLTAPLAQGFYRDEIVVTLGSVYAKFIVAGVPANPSGFPAGAELLFSGNAAGFVTNQGTGGTFTLTGTLTDADTSPSGTGSGRSVASGFVTTQAVGTIMVQKPGSLPMPPAAAQIADPCATFAALQAARIALLSGQRVQSVSIEGFTVVYGATDMSALERAITQYDELCRRGSGRAPRRFAIGSGARSRTY